MNTNGYDCLIIPIATKAAIQGMQIPGVHFCGQNLVSANENMVSTTVCSKFMSFSHKSLHYIKNLTSKCCFSTTSALRYRVFDRFLHVHEWSSQGVQVDLRPEHVHLTDFSYF